MREYHESQGTPSSRTQTKWNKASRQGKQSTDRPSWQPSRSFDVRWREESLGYVAVGLECCCDRGRTSGKIRSSCVQNISQVIQANRNGAPIEDPVFDAAIVIAGGVTGCGEGIYDLGLPI